MHPGPQFYSTTRFAIGRRTPINIGFSKGLSERCRVLGEHPLETRPASRSLISEPPQPFPVVSR